MKKTLLITLEFPPHIGGIATYTDQFARILPPEKLVVLAPPIETKDKEKAFFTEYKLYRKPLFFPKFIWPRWLLLVWQVWKIVKAENIEKIHVHHILPVGYAAYLMKRWKNIPYLIFSHGTDIAALGEKKRKKKLARKVTREAELIIANSENLRMRIVNTFPELAEKTSVLYPCPDTLFLQPPLQEHLEQLRHQYALEGKHVILSVSRLAEGKGFPHLIRLMPEILKHVPHLVWVIVGEGPKRDEILRDIQTHHLQNIVRFIGEVPHEELQYYYHLADVFLLLTHPDKGREEGLGLVFLEAAAAGLPVIAGKSGGVEEAVLHGQTGLVIDVYQEPHNIAKAIIDLIQNPQYARSLGAAGQERIQREFVWETQVRGIEKWL